MPNKNKDPPPSHPIFEKGMPFYKLKKKEYTPTMNLTKTFNTTTPLISNYKKEVEDNKWTEAYDKAFEIVLKDVDQFTIDNGFNGCQKAATFEIFYSCFKYMSLLPALEKEEFCEYFRNTLILYTVQDPPEYLRIFNCLQAFGIAKLFHELLVENFELAKHVLLPVYEIEIEISQLY